MASTALQIIAFILTFLGLMLLHAATVSNYWKHSTTAKDIITSSWMNEGLWRSCVATSFGSVQCKTFSSLLSLETMSIILELAGFVFTLGGWVLVGATLSNSYWKVSTVHGSVITSSSVYENLWHSCAEDSIGVSNCRAFDTLLALPAYIQACRALMITSLFSGMCGILLSLLGLKCTQLGSTSENMKIKIAITGGMLFILGGLSSIIAVSWYAARVTTQFFDSLYGGTKYELGTALYIGWAGSLLSILGGIFLTCSGCKEKHRKQKYDYAVAQRTNKSRIYIKKSETVVPVQDYV